MPENINLKEIERKTHGLYHQDGLIDIIIGSGIMSFFSGYIASSLISDSFLLYMTSTFSPIWIILSSYLYPHVKQNITAPRIGFVNFGLKRKQKPWLLVFLISGVTIIAWAIIIVMVSAKSGRNALESVAPYIGILCGLIGAGLALTVAVVAGLKRYYLYSTVILVVFIIGYLFNLFLFYSIFVIGVFIFLYGIKTFIQFLQKYPLPKEEISNGN